MEESTVIAIVIKTESFDHVELSKKFFHQTLFTVRLILGVDPPTLRSAFRNFYCPICSSPTYLSYWLIHHIIDFRDDTAFGANLVR